MMVAASFISLSSCGGGESDADSETTDSTDVAETEISIEEEEMPEELTYDGVAKGNYMLYGYSEIEASGDEATVENFTAALAETGEFDGKIAVNIDEVCQKAGCWITFNTNEDESVRVFFRNHFTIPVETTSGTEAILYGQAVQDTLTVDFQKHLLDDAAEAGQEVTQEEYDAITEDKIETTFDCESILVKTTE